MPQAFEGLAEKLIRTKQNINNLQFEIGEFFKSSKYPILPEDDREALLEAIEYHKKLAIPLRFSVLAGEIVHHLRSCLDHIVWHFSTDESYRRDCFRKIEFPIFEDEPLDKKSVSRYEGKIKGITDRKVIALIKRLQPYDSPDPIDDPLLIIHKMDIIDKHKELVLCVGTGGREIPMDTMYALVGNESQMSEKMPADLAFELKGYGKLVPQVSFRDFGRRPIQPIVPGLTQLNNYVVRVIAAFSEL
jgi:hypothetical protein